MLFRTFVQILFQKYVHRISPWIPSENRSEFLLRHFSKNYSKNISNDSSIISTRDFPKSIFRSFSWNFLRKPSFFFRNFHSIFLQGFFQKLIFFFNYWSYFKTHILIINMALPESKNPIVVVYELSLIFSFFEHI